MTQGNLLYISWKSKGNIQTFDLDNLVMPCKNIVSNLACGIQECTIH